MSIFFILFLFPLVGATPDDCAPKRCAKHGPLIQFPFRLTNKHPQHCGHPGFDLYCDRKHTLFPFSSVNLSVNTIDYKSQHLDLSDPQRCLIEKLIPDLNLSASSPFNFSSNSVDDFILFNCSSRRDLSGPVPCLSASAYKFYAVRQNSDMDSLSLASCTSVYNVSSVPSDVFDRNVLQLNWSEPACGSCEAQGRRCSSQNNTSGYQCLIIKTNRGASKKTVVIAGSLLGAVTAAALIYVCKLIITGRENQKKIEKFLEDYKAVKPTRFCYSDLRRITNQFSEKLGEGGYGVVYKGRLTSEISVAVKVLNNSKENGEEFVNEVSTIGRIHHINVVRLVGFCAEGFRRVLVYEFLPNDSLEKFIFQTESNRISLGWQKLEEIALGIAKGIEYLHQGCDQQILHFDIKPHNILLDQNLNPKICDFGLAKLCSKEQSAVTMTAARGTMGYIAPEVLSRTFGKVSYKSDVYSFGMLLLEMVGGRKNVDPKVNTSQIYFPEWVYSHLNLGEEFWAEIEGGEHGEVARKLAIVGLSCIHWHPTDRPSMKLVVQMLEGDGADLTMPPNPFPDPNFVQRHYQAELPLIPETDEQ